ARRPALAAARLALGRALHYAGDTLRAVREARCAVELAPGDADARSRLGGMLLGLGRVRDALAELERAVALDPSLPAARYNLASAGRELVSLARRGALDPVFGRDAEVDAVLDVLLRKKKSNPLLVGAAGVGKTAVVEGLAQRVASGAVPERLRGARVVELSLA